LQASKRRKTAIDESALHESCNEFSELLRSTFYKNMDRFELYANRNIFVPPSTRLAAKVTNMASDAIGRLTRSILTFVTRLFSGWVSRQRRR
jgi:hypothetical protein